MQIAARHIPELFNFAGLLIAKRVELTKPEVAREVLETLKATDFYGVTLGTSVADVWARLLCLATRDQEPAWKVARMAPAAQLVREIMVTMAWWMERAEDETGHLGMRELGRVMLAA